MTPCHCCCCRCRSCVCVCVFVGLMPSSAPQVCVWWGRAPVGGCSVCLTVPHSSATPSGMKGEESTHSSPAHSEPVVHSPRRSECRDIVSKVSSVQIKKVILLWRSRLQPGLAPPTQWPSARAWRTGPQPLTSPPSLTLTKRRRKSNWHRWCGSSLPNSFLFLSSLSRHVCCSVPLRWPAGTESWWRAAWPVLMTSSSTVGTSSSCCTRTRQECGKNVLQTQ